MTQVFIKTGTFKGRQIENQTARMLKPLTLGVRGFYGTFDIPGIGVARMTFPSEDHIAIEANAEAVGNEVAVPIAEVETDEDIKNRIADRFLILKEVTNGMVQGNTRSLIVSGPAGVGKSETIFRILNAAHEAGDVDYTVVKGTITSAYQLYKVLYENSNEDNVLVLDDSDEILFDDNAVNLLKAALESGRRPRVLSYYSQNLINDEIPTTFEFKGRIIFITNVDFQKIIDNDRKAISRHLSALISRSLYLDLTLTNLNEIVLWIQHMVKQERMLRDMGITEEQENAILEWIGENANRVRRLSLRTALQAAEFSKIVPDHWHRHAEALLLRNQR